MTAVRCPLFVGREVELAALVSASETARAGAGCVVLVTGESGVGKSRLLQEAAAAAEAAGSVVLYGRAVDGARNLPFRAVAEVVHGAERAGADASEATLGPYWRAVRMLAGDDAGTTRPGLLVLAEALLRLLENLAAQRSVAVVLDDLHWADPETITVVEYLADHVGGHRIAVLAAVRTGEPSEAQTLARSLAARRVAGLVELARLGDVEVGEMTRACLELADVPSALTGFLREYADGLPFFVEELLADARVRGYLGPDGDWVHGVRHEAQVPPSFVDTVGRRLKTLGRGARVVVAAAVLGREFDWTLLGQVAGVGETVVDEALQEALGCQLLERSGDGAQVRFRHALTREAVLADLVPSARRETAARALEAVLDREGPALDIAGCQLAARLCQECGDGQGSAGYLLEAGRAALQDGALDTAVAMLDTAHDRCANDLVLAALVQETLANALAQRGDADRVFTTGDALLHTLRALDASPARRAAVHLTLARAAVAAERWEVAAEQLDVAAATTGATEVTCRAGALAAQVAIGRGDTEQAVTLAAEAVDQAQRLGLLDVACEALEVVGRAERLADLDRADATFRQALELAERNDLPLWRARALHEVATIDFLRSFRVEPLQEALVAAEGVGAVSLCADIEAQLAALYGVRFEAEAVLHTSRRSVQAARRLGLGSLPMALVRLGVGHMLELDRDAMEADVAEALAISDDPAVHALVWGQCRAHLSLLMEQRSRARQELDEAMRWTAHSRNVPPAPFRALWTLVRTIEGDDPAAADAALAETAPEVLASTLGRAMIGYTRAVRRGRGGDPVGAQAEFAAAEKVISALHGGQGYQFLCRRLVAETALRDGWGEPAGWLAEPLAFATERGYQRLAAACRGLLRQAGVAVHRRGRGDSVVPDDLAALGITTREMDVLVLLAEGLTNRQIGERLFLSPRTVGTHVASLLRKTGRATRAQLAALAAGHATPTVRQQTGTTSATESPAVPRR